MVANVGWKHMFLHQVAAPKRSGRMAPCPQPADKNLGTSSLVLPWPVPVAPFGSLGLATDAVLGGGVCRNDDATGWLRPSRALGVPSHRRDGADL
jgi:hypothetical protein